MINVDDVALLQDTAAAAAALLVGGMDCAGVALAVGPDCRRVKVGDSVCGIAKVAEYQAGTWAEQTIAPEGDLCLMGDAEISLVESAGCSTGGAIPAKSFTRKTNTTPPPTHMVPPPPPIGDRDCAAPSAGPA